MYMGDSRSLLMNPQVSDDSLNLHCYAPLE